jgi:hypothetical protein
MGGGLNVQMAGELAPIGFGITFGTLGISLDGDHSWDADSPHADWGESDGKERTMTIKLSKDISTSTGESDAEE